MDITTYKDFFTQINSESNFNNQNIYLEGEILEIRTFISNNIVFDSCTFYCDSLKFLDIVSPELLIHFNNCTFHCSVQFTNCHIEGLTFLNTKKLKALRMFKGLDQNNLLQISTFSFENKILNEIGLDTKFSFNKCIFTNRFEFKNINHTDGFFDFQNNILGQENTEFTYIIFYTSNLFNCHFVDNHFKSMTQFHEINFSYLPFEKLLNTVFRTNIFGEVSFSRSSFSKIIIFSECDFLSTVYFGECKNISDSEVNLIGCEFKGFSLFNESIINSLNIDRCTFVKSCSFSYSEFNKLRLFEVKFEKGAYFDDMIINNVVNLKYLKGDRNSLVDWKKTLRTIKQELQKTDNRIDYNHYKAYELEAYNADLTWFENFNDKSTLFFYRISSYYGTNWKKAFAFTAIVAFLFFTLFYILENFNSSVDFENWQDFLFGYFRFFLITDFKNEYYIHGEAVLKFNNYTSFIPFIFGKILIAFGIYEMIQSFRKFKS